MDGEEIRRSIAIEREQWRRAREGKLSRKRDLRAGGAAMAAVRRDRPYRDFRKIQRRCAALIRHLERRLNRMRAREQNKP
jgi:hypothetical protein